METLTRRHFMTHCAAIGAGLPALRSLALEQAASRMKFGLVTYRWGENWTLPELLSNCEAAGLFGVELRTTHKHGVEPSLSKVERTEVRKRFEDSPVACVGIGSNERFDNPEPAILERAIEATKEFVVLSHDVGGSGVKVKPDSFHEGVSRDKTIAQIGETLNLLGAFGADYGQQIRLEVHGQCARLPIIKQIVDIADHPNVALCWNSNRDDMLDGGLHANFHLVRNRFGATAHVHELNSNEYPYAELFRMLVDTEYDGWVLLEASSSPADPVAALIDQRERFEDLVSVPEKSVA